MKKVTLLLLVLAAGLPAADIAGSWGFYLVSFGEETSPARLEIKVQGDKLTGTLNEIQIEGTVRDDTFTFTGKRPNGDEFARLEGRLKGDELAGTAHFGGEERQWIARRVKVSTADRKSTRL